MILRISVSFVFINHKNHALESGHICWSPRLLRVVKLGPAEMLRLPFREAVSLPETDEVIEDCVRDIRLELQKIIAPRLGQMINLINAWPEAPSDVKLGLLNIKLQVDRILELHASLSSVKAILEP